MKNRTVRFTIVISTMLLILISLIYMLLVHNGMVQVSADFEEETAIWQVWIIALFPLLMTLRPWDKEQIQPLYKEVPKSTWALVTLAIVLILLMIVTPKSYVFDLFYIYKLILLFVIPLIIIKRDSVREIMTIKTVRRWKEPLLVVVVWLVFYMLSPLSEASTYEIDFLTLLLGALISLILNAVLEELFYRKWLQSRLEAAFGIWPAICVSAVLWALWHTGIQGSGGWIDSTAHALVLHGMMGLFLGYFWAKYRNIWLLIFIHGMMNFPVILITMWFE